MKGFASKSSHVQFVVRPKVRSSLVRSAPESPQHYAEFNPHVRSLTSEIAVRKYPNIIEHYAD